MAQNMAEVTVKIDAEITEASKQVLRGLILEILHEDLEAGGIIAPFVSTSDLKAYVATEVRKALKEVTRDARTRAGLPAWTRHEEGVGTQETVR